NNPHGIVHLQAVFEAKSASGVTFQHPFLLHLRSDPCRTGYGFSGSQCEVCRRKEIISRASGCRTSGKNDLFINSVNLCFRCLRKFIFPVFQETVFADFMESGNSFHVYLLKKAAASGKRSLLPPFHTGLSVCVRTICPSL